MTTPREPCEAWRCLLELLAAERSRLPAIAAELGLSEPQALALRALDPDEPVAMCRVAEALACDPSNVTGIVRRLESRGLVARNRDPEDRRVRRLALTAAGREQRARLIERLAEPPPGIRDLPPGDQRTLHRILERALAMREARVPDSEEDG